MPARDIAKTDDLDRSTCGTEGRGEGSDTDIQDANTYVKGKESERERESESEPREPTERVLVL